jgi:F0F1-type ATP synthase epsilon subunit
MHVYISCLRDTLYDQDAISVTCTTTTGVITVLENHRSLITVLAPGTLTVTTANHTVYSFTVDSGIMEVQNNKIRIVSSHARKISP